MAAKEVEPYKIDDGFWEPFNKCTNCGAQSWQEKRGTEEYWHCCDNVKNNLIPPDQSKKYSQIDQIDDGPEKEWELLACHINDLIYSMGTTYIYVAGIRACGASERAKSLRNSRTAIILIEKAPTSLSRRGPNAILLRVRF